MFEKSGWKLSPEEEAELAEVRKKIITKKIEAYSKFFENLIFLKTQEGEFKSDDPIYEEIGIKTSLPLDKIIKLFSKPSKMD